MISRQINHNNDNNYNNNIALKCTSMQTPIKTIGLQYPVKLVGYIYRINI